MLRHLASFSRFLDIHSPAHLIVRDSSFLGALILGAIASADPVGVVFYYLHTVPHLRLWICLHSDYFSDSQLVRHQLIDLTITE